MKRYALRAGVSPLLGVSASIFVVLLFFRDMCGFCAHISILFNLENSIIQIFDAKFIILTTKNCIRNHCKQIETVLYLIIVFEILLKACGLGRNRPDSASRVLQEETL